MNKEAAKQVLVERVFAPGFIKRCADRGVAISDRSTLEQALRCYVELRKQKQAEAKSVIKSAHDDLMESVGIRTEPAPVLDPGLVDACLAAVS